MDHEADSVIQHPLVSLSVVASCCEGLQGGPSGPATAPALPKHLCHPPPVGLLHTPTHAKPHPHLETTAGTGLLSCSVSTPAKLTKAL